MRTLAVLLVPTTALTLGLAGCGFEPCDESGCVFDDHTTGPDTPQGPPAPDITCDAPWFTDQGVVMIAEGGSARCDAAGNQGATVTAATPFTVTGDDVLVVHAHDAGSTTMTTDWGEYTYATPFEAREVASVSLLDLEAYRPLTAGPTTYLEGDDLGVAIALADADGHRLVDADLRVKLDGAPRPVTYGWDQLALGRLPAGTHLLAISDGAAAGVSLPFDVVAAIDETAAVWSDGADRPAQPGQTGEVCFHVFADGAEVTTRWQLTATGPASVATTDALNCVSVYAERAGHIEISAARRSQPDAPLLVIEFDV